MKNYVPEDVSPGLLFTDPYADLLTRTPSRLYSPGQTGPHIYDNDGELVWSGAELYRDRSTFDFKMSTNGSEGAEQTLTFILGGDDHDIDQPGGAGIVLDSTYTIQQRVHVKGGTGTMNMHEFSTVNDGKNALLIAFKNHLFDSRGAEGLKPDFVGWVVDLGFLEIDIATQRVLFEWWASDHVNPTESTVHMPPMPGSGSRAWDYL